MKIWLKVAMAVAMTCAALGSVAQEFPDRPIRMIIAYPPGGGADLLGRIIGQKMSEAMGQQVIVENSTGGGGSIGTTLAARAAPNGYTVMLGMPGTHAILPYIMRNLPYDPVKDFAPVTLLCNLAYVLVVHPGVQASSTSELVALAKASPGVFNFGSAGIGSETHLMGEMFRSVAAVDIVHVPYRGTGPALAAVMSGESKMMFTPLAAAVPHIKSGRLKAISVIGARRSSFLPDVPTIVESGMPAFDLASWAAIFAPAATPQNIVDQLSGVISKIVRSPEIRERFAGLGAESVGGTSAELREFLKGEIDKYGKLVKLSGVKPE